MALLTASSLTEYYIPGFFATLFHCSHTVNFFLFKMTFQIIWIKPVKIKTKISLVCIDTCLFYPSLFEGQWSVCFISYLLAWIVRFQKQVRLRAAFGRVLIKTWTIGVCKVLQANAYYKQMSASWFTLTSVYLYIYTASGVSINKYFMKFFIYSKSGSAGMG